MNLSTSEALLANLRWWGERKDNYPHTCRTHLDYPNPAYVQAQMPDKQFACVPLGKVRVWGFMSAEDLREFKRLYVTLDNKKDYT